MDQDIASQELNLNIEHQIIEEDDFMTVGYEYEKGKYILLLMFPKTFFKEIGLKLK